MGFILGWIVFSVVAALISSNKGRGFFGVFFLSLLLSPVVGLIVALVMDSKAQLDAKGAMATGAQGDFRKCPFCAEAIRKEAIKCKHCGSDVEPIVDDVARRPVRKGP
jgi:hypothetical protein